MLKNIEDVMERNYEMWETLCNSIKCSITKAGWTKCTMQVYIKRQKTLPDSIRKKKAVFNPVALGQAFGRPAVRL